MKYLHTHSFLEVFEKKSGAPTYLAGLPPSLQVVACRKIPRLVNKPNILLTAWNSLKNNNILFLPEQLQLVCHAAVHSFDVIIKHLGEI